MAANEPGQPPCSADARAALTTDVEVPRVALAVGAHPDDVEFGGGATLARWAAAGCQVHNAVLTDGSKGSWDPGVDPRALAERRRGEQVAAARALGTQGDVHFFDQIDGALTHSAVLVGRLARLIREVRPDVVLGHDPWKRYRLHPDHRIAGLLVCDAIVAARDPHFFPEHGLPAHRPEALLLWEADVVNHVESVDEAALAAKLAALESHVSQFESTMHATNERELDAFRTRIRERLTENGATLGRGPVECFHLMTDL